MDNFLDKLAQRYNAGEMIKANTEADTAEMQNLQEQVEAYEAVLQEMRKLNYKNTELTEKMYSLVDESIEKVRTLQIAASENGANPELISREMSDAVTGALNEALNNMDSTVARTISESLATALAQPTEALSTKLDSITDMSVKTDRLSEMIALLQATADQNLSLTQNLSENKGQDQDTKLLVDATSASVTSIKASVDDVNANILEIKNSVESINENSELLVNNIDEIKNASDSVKASIDAVNANVLDSKISVEVVSGNVAEIKNSVELTNSSLAEIKEAVANQNNQVSFDEETKNYITNIWNSVEATRNAVAEGNKKESNDSACDEVKAMMLELQSDSNEIKTSVRNIKAAGDENKTFVKTTIDSAIYGLKQDNKEMVEFMQRMNSNITASKNDPDAERKEEEARQKEEENKKALEERFKQTEDFMHKESVKVYRNVQAVINEKGDQQTAGLETKIKTNTAQIGQVKAIAIAAAVLSGLSFVAQVLQIFGIL